MFLALILAPILAGLVVYCVRAKGLRTAVVWAVALAAGCGALMLRAQGEVGIPLDHHWAHAGMMGAEILMGLFVLYVGVRARHWLIVLLALAQGGVMAWFELGPGRNIAPGGAGREFFVDYFAVIMAWINGLVGGGICLYALGYMREYHEEAHRDVPDRRPLFFATMLVFMGGMFGLVFANSLTWLFLFWEMTTLCSYLLIGYTQTPEARRNARLALVMNMAGGLAFALAIVWLQMRTGNIELQSLVASKNSLALLPAALLCFAGITKSAQLPFSGWLLGAMVAPTPVSALLHSSTMVKAGVYLVLRMAPLIAGTNVGLMVALVGGVTFLVGSAAAITSSDAKRVLAWSTVANLGLIVMCGGIGTYAAVWAGVLLIIFHAVAKCLLFLCVGVVEHKLHSRDIDAMSALVKRMPHVAVMMLIGMAGMFLAPFGMLISKWAVLKAVVDAYPLLSVFIVFGGSATLFFWVKWMGQLVQVPQEPERVEKELHLGEAVALYGLAAATFLACLLFPVISKCLIEPYVLGVYGQSASLGQGNVFIMIIMMGLIVLFPLGLARRSKKLKLVDPYLCGANAVNGREFAGSAGAVEKMTMRNYYLRGVFNEMWLMRWGVISCTALQAVMVVLAWK